MIKLLDSCMIAGAFSANLVTSSEIGGMTMRNAPVISPDNNKKIIVIVDQRGNFLFSKHVCKGTEMKKTTPYNRNGLKSIYKTHKTTKTTYITSTTNGR